jgi:hypothetical protein
LDSQLSDDRFDGIGPEGVNRSWSKFIQKERKVLLVPGAMKLTKRYGPF